MRFPSPLPSISPTARASRCSRWPWRCSAWAAPARTSTSAAPASSARCRWAAPAARSRRFRRPRSSARAASACCPAPTRRGNTAEHRPAVHGELRVERDCEDGETGPKGDPNDHHCETASSACGRRRSATSTVSGSASAATSSAEPRGPAVEAAALCRSRLARWPRSSASRRLRTRSDVNDVGLPARRPRT